MEQPPSPGSEPIPPIPPVPPSAPYTPPPPPTPAAGSELPPPPPIPPEAPAASLPPPMPDQPVVPPTDDEKLWGLLIHLSGVLGWITYTHAIPGGNLLIPLIIWLIKRDSSAFLNDQGKEAVNFHITMTIVGAVLLCIVCVGWVFLIPLGIYAVVVSVIAGMKAYEGVAFRYPLIFRLVR